MTEVAENSTVALLTRRLRDPAAWITTVDVFAILAALSLPWSTSLTAIFATALLVTMGPFLDVRAFLQSLKRPICAVPIALCTLAVVGTLWSDAPWGARLYATGPTVKLLMLPVLLFHFERSARGLWVRRLPGFLHIADRDVVDRLLPSRPVAEDVRSRAGYFRQELYRSEPGVHAMRGRAGLSDHHLAVFGLLHLKWRTNLVICCAAIVVSTIAWTASPRLQWTITTFTRDYQLYNESGTPTSIGERLEFWRKSLRFIVEAPLVGHGTGSTRGLFEKAATGPEGFAASRVIGNPHNQTLNVAVQWGAIGACSTPCGYCICCCSVATAWQVGSGYWWSC